MTPNDTSAPESGPIGRPGLCHPTRPNCAKAPVPSDLVVPLRRAARAREGPEPDGPLVSRYQLYRESPSWPP